MYEWRNAKVTGQLRKAFEVATDIAWTFEDEKIRSAYVLFAAMFDEESGISKAFIDMNMRMVPILSYYINNKEIFTEIFGEKAAEKFFQKDEEQTEVDVVFKPEGEEETEDDKFKAKVADVLIDMFTDIAADMEFDEEITILEPAYSDKLEAACDEALRRCNAANKDYIDLDSLIYCILQNKEGSAYRFISGVITDMELDVDDFIQSLKVTANICDVAEDSITFVSIPSSLETCVENYNNKYTKGEECTILGRDKEIFKAFNVFSKKTKRNCVLVGPPGVGKTAIIEAITQAIVNETCPKEFVGYTVLSLDVNSMVAGTKYRGEFETKVAILKQFLENTPKVILFVDEMHQMLGAGGTSEGTVDLSGSLKPILSRDDVVFVGATTTNEYEQILSRDGAFKRRFEVIEVKEPKNDEIKGMIKAKLAKMEKYHKVRMPAKLIDYIILCSNCFNFDSCNPDKTLDLCDRSMAIAKMENKKTVTKHHVNKVYEECFKMYDNISKKDIVGTAYHEIGHYVVTRLTKKGEAMNVTAVSIIPGNDFLGINVLEYKDTFVPTDKEYAEAYIMSVLAGRVAEARISKHINSGATSDLKKAKEFAKKVIAEYGMDDSDEFKNIYLMDDDLFNEQLAAKIDEKANQMIKRLYTKTEIFVADHWETIDKMAKYLIKNKIVTSEELDKFLTE